MTANSNWKSLGAACHHQSHNRKADCNRPYSGEAKGCASSSLHHMLERDPLSGTGDLNLALAPLQGFGTDCH